MDLSTILILVVIVCFVPAVILTCAYGSVWFVRALAKAVRQ